MNKKTIKKVCGLFMASVFSVAAAAAQPQNTLTAQEEQEGWQLLFDGKTTQGWRSYNRNDITPAWSARNGELIFKPAQGTPGGDIVTEEEFDNFDLRLEWRISRGGNSGIFFSVQENPKHGSAAFTGVEMQILDNIDGGDRHDPTHLAGAMYDLVDASETSKPAPVGEWNQVRILKNNGQVTFWLNGIVTANVYMDGYQWRDMVAGSKFSAAAFADFGRFHKGRLALQDHGDEVAFRNIKILKYDKIIGLQLYSLREEIGGDFDGVIKAVGEMGYRQAEAAGYGDGKFYGLTPAEYKSRLLNVGIVALSSHTGNVPGDVSQLYSDGVIGWWDQAIAAHKEAGMKYLVIPGISVPKNLADMKKVCEFFNYIGKKCKDAGILLGYHNHSFEYQKIEDRVMYDFMLENTDPEYVFFQMDIYWTVLGGHGPVEYFRRYPGRFKLLHVKDRKELGESGLVNFDAVFDNAAIAGVEALIVELEASDHTMKEGVKMSLDYLLNSPHVEPDYSKQ